SQGTASGSFPPSSANCCRASASLRSCQSESITVAPSSTARRAVAKPIPVPAAAVTRTTLSCSRPCGGGGGGVLGTGQPQDALGDDVLLDLAGSGVDGIGPAEKVQPLRVGQVVRRVVGDQRFHPEHVHRQLAEPPVPFRPEQFPDGRGRR